VPKQSIVGRDGELGRIWRMVPDVAAGRGGVVWVAGEPGIGKSALVDVGVGGAEACGVRVFRGVADQLTQSFALRLMADCLGVDRGSADQYRLEIADLLAGRVGEVDAVRAASERMVALVERECARSPVLVVGDDLQWADEASLVVWRRLVELIDQMPLLLVGVSRPVPQRAAVDRVRQAAAKARDAVVVDLRPLGGGDVSAMVEALLSAAPGPHLQESLTQAGGNPLYVREMVDALVGAGLVRVRDGVAHVAGSAMPDLSSLNAAIGRRLGFLSIETRLVLRASAVLGGRFTVDDLAVVSGQRTGVPGDPPTPARPLLGHNAGRRLLPSFRLLPVPRKRWVGRCSLR
jgi:AAA ATPase domain